MDAPEVREEISEYYEQDSDESQRISAGLGELELIRTREIVTRHLPAGRLRVLDVGGGTGVHARWLAEDGHDVVLIDPILRHVRAAQTLAASGLSIHAQLGDARQLDVANSVDAVLLLGPLYHLTELADRLQVFREALQVVKPGGLIIAAAISRFASLFDGLARGALFDPAFQVIVQRDLRDGQHRNPGRRPGWFTTAYFHHPDELEDEATESGAEVIELVGVEGLAGWLPQLDEHWAIPTVREAILASARTVESERSLRGLSAHLLVVARRPG
jgi:SAM-dependent methyltransferase